MNTKRFTLFPRKAEINNVWQYFENINNFDMRKLSQQASVYIFEQIIERKEGNVLLNDTHFIYGYMASAIW